MSDFKFSCPHCAQGLEAPEEMIGQTVDCPVCNGRITIPQPEPATQQPPEESPSHPAPPLPAEKTPLDAPSQSMQAEDGQTKLLLVHARYVPDGKGDYNSVKNLIIQIGFSFLCLCMGAPAVCWLYWVFEADGYCWYHYELGLILLGCICILQIWFSFRLLFVNIFKPKKMQEAWEKDRSYLKRQKPDEDVACSDSAQPQRKAPVQCVQLSNSTFETTSTLDVSLTSPFIHISVSISVAIAMLVCIMCNDKGRKPFHPTTFDIALKNNPKLFTRWKGLKVSVRRPYLREGTLKFLYDHSMDSSLVLPKATSFETLGSIVMLDRKDEVVGIYGFKGTTMTVNKITFTVYLTIIDWVDRLIVDKKAFQSGPPPQNVYLKNGSLRGDYRMNAVLEEVNKYLRSLPRVDTRYKFGDGQDGAVHMAN